MSAAEDQRIIAEFARKLSEIMDKKGISVRDLASEADLTPSYISNLRNGQRKPSITVLVYIARALDVPLASLVPQ
jgi:transcriptional regulator with XRE-family HTH domain